jgi:multidrug efflux system outer membrane protein
MMFDIPKLVFRFGCCLRRALPGIVACALAACASAPIERSGVPEAPAAFKEGNGLWTAAAPAEAQARGEWWKAFSDPVLDDLVQRAAASNTDIQLAVARLAQARALVRAANAGLLPQLGLRTSAARQGGPLINAAGGGGTLITSAADFSYELDLFGRLSETSRAASLDAEARQGLLQSTQLLVQSDVARTYLDLRAIDAERAIVRSSVAAYRDTVDLTQRRFEAGSVAELDVVRARSELAATESEMLVLDRRRAELEHALALLAGEVASNFSLAEAEWSTSLPMIPAGVPSTVLTRRPDVSAAQRSMQAAQARVGVANKAWFPTLSLTSSAGYASPDLGDLFKMASRFWAIGAVLALPIFDGGKREAARDNASAELDAAFASYRERILVAFRDVEDQLSSLRVLADHAAVQSSSVASASRATVLSESRYRSGLGSQLEVLDARRSELRSRRQALQVRAAQYQATVGLVRALGGGWGTESAGRRDQREVLSAK